MKILALAVKNIEVNFIFLARLFVSLQKTTKTGTWKQPPNSMPTTSRSILQHIQPNTY